MGEGTRLDDLRRWKKGHYVDKQPTGVYLKNASEFNVKVMNGQMCIRDRLWSNRINIRQDETLRSLLFIMAKHRLINAYRQKRNHPIYEEYIYHIDTLSTEDTHYKLEYNEFLFRFLRCV